MFGETQNDPGQKIRIFLQWSCTLETEFNVFKAIVIRDDLNIESLNKLFFKEERFFIYEGVILNMKASFKKNNVKNDSLIICPPMKWKKIQYLLSKAINDSTSPSLEDYKEEQMLYLGNNSRILIKDLMLLKQENKIHKSGKIFFQYLKALETSSNEDHHDSSFVPEKPLKPSSEPLPVFWEQQNLTTIESLE